MKTWRMILTALSLTLALGACGQQAPAPEADLEPEQPAKREITYSNLNDQESRDQAVEVMTAAGIAPERIQVLLDHVDQFNALMKPEELTAGLETHDIQEQLYDPYEVQDRWDVQYPEFMGYNCRITAYGIFGDQMTVPADAEIRDQDLMFDLMSLEADDSAFPGETESFSAVYSMVPTESTLDVETHAARWLQDWQDRGIAFADQDKASLISMVFHSDLDGDYLFVGHTGVLFPADDGLYFLEKIAFQAPYRWLRFENRTELSDYLMTMHDLDVGQVLAHPFILENDQLMEGYRPKPAL